MDKALEQAVVELEGVLRDQLAQHDRLASLIAAKREALGRADRPRIVELCGEENQCVQVLGEMEKERLAVAARVTLLINPTATAPMALPELAMHLPDPLRSRLLTLRGQLRARMEDTKRSAAVAAQASQALLRHMQGLVQTVGGLMTGVQTYTRQGARPQAATRVSTFSATA